MLKCAGPWIASLPKTTQYRQITLHQTSLFRVSAHTKGGPATCRGKRSSGRESTRGHADGRLRSGATRKPRRGALRGDLPLWQSVSNCEFRIGSYNLAILLPVYGCGHGRHCHVAAAAHRETAYDRGLLDAPCEVCEVIRRTVMVVHRLPRIAAPDQQCGSRHGVALGV